MWLGYVIFREAYLIGVGEYVALRSPSRNWIDCHVVGSSVFPPIAGC